MAGSPKYKIYDLDGEYVASVKYPVLCAAILSAMQEGSTVRLGHGKTIYTSGKDGDPGESYDVCAETIERREYEINVETYERQYGKGSAAAITALRNGE